MRFLISGTSFALGTVAFSLGYALFFGKEPKAKKGSAVEADAAGDDQHRIPPAIAAE